MLKVHRWSQFKVDALSYYSLGPDQLAEHLDLSGPRTTALIRYLKLQDDPEYFKEFQIMSQHFARYTQKALERLQKELPQVDMEEVWPKYKSKKVART